MTEPYHIFGRRVVAYVPTETPNNVLIDVLQQDGECPKRLVRAGRKVCSLDCADTFAAVGFNLFKGDVYLNLFLAHNFTRFRQESSLPTITQDSRKFKRMKPNKIYLLRANGKQTTEQCFFAGVNPGTNTGIAAVDRYFQYINSHVMEVMEACGVKVIRTGKNAKVEIDGAKNRRHAYLTGRILEHLMRTQFN